MPQGIKSGSTNQTQGNNKNGDRKAVEFPIRETESSEEARVGKDESFIKVFRRIGDDQHKEEAKSIPKVIKYLKGHPMALIGFLSTVASATIVFICQQYWSESHQYSVYEHRRYLRDTAIYQKLIDGPSFDDMECIPRKVLQDGVRSLLDPLLIPCGISRLPDPARERSPAVQPPSTLSACAWLPVPSSDVRGFAGNVEKRQMIREAFASGFLKNRVGSSDVRGFAGNVEKRQMIREAILVWLQIRFMMITWLAPSSRARLYPLVVGQHGVGKTTLIRLAINALPIPKGVIYFDVASGVDPVPFTSALQRSIGWSADPILDASKSMSSSVMVIVSEANGLDGLDDSDLWKALFTAASKFRKDFGVVPVIIIENANKLAPEILVKLQDFAKNAIDSNSATFMFVSSEGLVPRIMMERSAWSRHGEILEVGDMTKEEALDYFRAEGLEVEATETAYNLVGGRIVHLRLIADALNAGRDFDGIQQNLLRDARENIQLMPGARYHNEGSQIIKALLKGQRLSEEEYYKKYGFDTGYSLLEKHVFALHVNSSVITFQSRLIERYCESQQDLWQTVEKA